MEIISQVFYFIVIIGILVFVHELGHFLAAKLFKMRVERFSIGFPPRAFGKKIGETDYCVSWLPIGGYVKISGMIDESLDTEHLSREPEPWEFRAKPVWQRMIVIVAGVLMNILLAVGIFWGLNLTQGKKLLEITTVGYVAPESIAEQSGFRNNDQILAVNGMRVSDWDAILNQISINRLSDDLRFRVKRGGKTETIFIAKADVADLEIRDFGIAPLGVHSFVGAVQSGLPAEKAGIQAGDVFVSINDVQISLPYDVTRIIEANPSTPVKLVYNRNGKEYTKIITPSEEGKIGVAVDFKVPEGSYRIEKYGVFEAFTHGMSGLFQTVRLFFESIGNILFGKASFQENIGGPIKIAKMAAQQAEYGITNFISLMALLSVSLALINIVPFPGLDGGHFGFLVYEAIFRKEVPKKIYLAMQQTGMVLLIAFMIFVLYNDLAPVLSKKNKDKNNTEEVQPPAQPQKK